MLDNKRTIIKCWFNCLSLSHLFKKKSFLDGQRFEVNQSQDGDETKTTIVVVNEDFEENNEKEIDSKDLVTLAIDQSGLEPAQNFTQTQERWSLPKIGSALSLNLEQNEYEENISNEADEILKGNYWLYTTTKYFGWIRKIKWLT